MTVATTANKAQFNGNGSTGPFTFNFRFFANTDIVVIRTSIAGVDTTLIETTHYALTGAGSYNGGSVTLVTALQAGERLTIQRVLPKTQLTDLRNQGAFFAETHEDVFDRAVMLIQQLNELLSRAPLLPATSPLSNLEVPPPGAGLYIRWNAAGTALEAVGLAATVSLANMDYGAAPPMSGGKPLGWIRWNTAPVAGGNVGWVCLVAGEPGTWAAFGIINA